ncbi:PREDICTED: uncharacterized protein LOC107188642 [Dufourea novaeangliae]|uniref:Cyclin-dependent kinase inhibitor domain-containing protein n=1 Tax=Dufourea novaeangliae TaxID=178035 RepID=A0A154NXW0_DUFNO|nr:PREDICTED: uncharacterized protein LOC107188642 [Dufourea novaeangliae]KZC04392.1 hypothetical protein WN55_02754 [Dufourea novaeangliae]
MLAASICREVHFTVLSGTTMASRVPRCLFGKPNSRETVEMLQEALDVERSRFAKRWGVDPCSEDKENNYQRKHVQDKHEPSPKKRCNPYSRQTNIHDYWRARKVCEVNKKPLGSSLDTGKQQTDATKTAKTIVKSSKKTAQN